MPLHENRRGTGTPSKPGFSHKKEVQCKNLGDIDSIVQKWNLDHNENASWRMYITHEGDSICIVQKNGYKIQAQILVNH